MIDAVLREAGVRLDAVRGIVLSDGPGSFTGLRVGAAVAKALVQARGLPLWIAPSLMVRAAGVARPGATVLAVSDALRGELYAAAYRFDAERRPHAARAGGPPARGARRGRAVAGRPRGRASRARPASCWSAGRDVPSSGRRSARRTRGCCSISWAGRAARVRVEPVAGLAAGVRSARRGAGTLGDGAWTPPTGFDRQPRLTPPALVAIERRALQRSVERGELPRGADLGVDLRAGGGDRARARGLLHRARGRRHRRGAEPGGRAGVSSARRRRRAARRGPLGASAAAGGGGLPRGARVQPLGAGALSRPMASGRWDSGRRTTGIRARTRWCSGWSWSSAREPVRDSVARA